jgi:hypothetical protein
MQTYFVRVECDVTAKVHEQPLRYRAYVNNELFSERTWIWDNCYLEENFQISAPAGVYPIRFETVNTDRGRIKVRDFRVVAGPGRIIEYQGETAVEISNEST